MLYVDKFMHYRGFYMIKACSICTKPCPTVRYSRLWQGDVCDDCHLEMLAESDPRSYEAVMRSKNNE